MPKIKNLLPFLPMVIHHLGHHHSVVLAARKRKPTYFNFFLHVEIVAQIFCNKKPHSARSSNAVQ
jgi:hypothetical protein